MDDELRAWTLPWSECLDERGRRRERVPPPSTYGLLLGSPKSGKTYLLRWLYREYFSKIYDVVFFFSMSDDLSSAFSDEIAKVKSTKPERRDFAGKWDEGVRMAALRKINLQRKGEGSRPLHSMVVFDDVFRAEKNADDVALSFLQGRHAHQAIIFSSQRFRLLPSAARSTFDWIALGKPPNSQEELDEMVKEYFSLRWIESGMSERIGVEGVPRKNQRAEGRLLRRYILDNTKDHRFLVLVPDEWEWYESVFEFRAP